MGGKRQWKSGSVHTGWFSSWFSLGGNGHQPKAEFSATLRTFVLTFHCRSLPLFGLSCRSLCLIPQVVSGSGQASEGSCFSRFGTAPGSPGQGGDGAFPLSPFHPPATVFVFCLLLSPPLHAPPPSPLFRGTCQGALVYHNTISHVNQQN